MRLVLMQVIQSLVGALSGPDSDLAFGKRLMYELRLLDESTNLNQHANSLPQSVSNCLLDCMSSRRHMETSCRSPCSEGLSSAGQ